MANPFQFKTKLKTLSNNGSSSLYNEIFKGKKNVIISQKSGGGLRGERETKKIREKNMVKEQKN